MLSSRGRVGCHLSENPGAVPAFFYSSIPVGGSYPDFTSEEFRRNSSIDEVSVGLLLEQDNKKVFIAPSISGRNPEWKRAVASADLVSLDGTFWSEDERRQPAARKKLRRKSAIFRYPVPTVRGSNIPRTQRGAKSSSTSTTPTPSWTKRAPSIAPYWKPDMKSPTME